MPPSFITYLLACVLSRWDGTGANDNGQAIAKDHVIKVELGAIGGDAN